MRKLGLLAALILGGCVTAPPVEPSPDHLHWRAAATNDTAPRPWAILLPGGGGLDIFGDGGAYYFSFAEMLNRRGFDVLVVHYQEDARSVEEVGMPNYGAEIARTVYEGVSYERGLSRMDPRCDGVLFSWSMGGEGLLELAARDPALLPGLRSAIAYYPSVQGRPDGFMPRIDLTILQGEEDQLTTLAALNRFLAAGEAYGAVTLHTLAGAKHGFDITTLKEPVLEASFAYDPANAALADALLDATLTEGDYGCALD